MTGEAEQAVAAVLAEALHRATCAEPWDACCWSMEDPDLTDCHDEAGDWRQVGLEDGLAAALAPHIAAERARALDEAADSLLSTSGPQDRDCGKWLRARADRERGEATTT